MGKQVGVAWVVVLTFAACADPTGLESCLDNGGTSLGSSGCLDMSQAGALDQATQREIGAQIASTVDLASARMKLPRIHLVVNTDLARVIPEVGLGGFAPNANEVFVSIDPNRSDLTEVIRDALPPLLAHELHHAARHAAAGYGSSLFEAVVSEGLADHFSIELFEIAPPPWATALSDNDLTTWTEAVLSDPAGPYDHSKWFFGADGTVPRWTAYSVGFAIVGAFLEASPERRPSDLVSEPASSFRVN